MFSIRRYILLLGVYLRVQRWRVAAFGLLFLATVGLKLYSPQALRAFIDAAQIGAPLGALLVPAVVFIGAALVQQVVALGSTYFGEVIAWRATNQLRANLARHALQLDMRFHGEHTPGEMIERIDGDVTALANFFSQFLVLVVGNVLLIVGVVALLFWEHWTIGLLGAAFAVAALVAMGSMRGRVTPLFAQARQASADTASFMEERLAGLEDIKASGADAYKLNMLHNHQRILFERYRRARVWSSVGPIMASTLYAIVLAGALGLAAFWFSRGVLTLGAVFLVGYYIRLIREPLYGIMNQLDDLQRAGASIERVEALLHTQSPLRDGVGVVFPAGPLAMEFRGVSFRYGSEESGIRVQGSENAFVTPDSRPLNPVLHNISFRLEPGRVLGLLGRTGSGKSTITRLIFRQYDATAGSVCVGDRDVREARVDELRERIGMVTQEVQLFRGTIRENLTFFNDQIPDGAILHAISELGLREWLDAQSNGLDSMIASGGRSLSAGEAQLLAFTRVLLQNPGIVILDEASSRLDPATEQRIAQAMRRLLHNRTGIIIAHRLGTVEQVDEIMILENGTIAEHGERETLLAMPESRYTLLRQLGGEAAEG